MPADKPTEIGVLRHRISIDELVEVQDPDTGVINEEWMTFITGWAQVKPLSGEELFQAKQISASVTHEVKIRYREGIRPKMRVVFGAKLFDIEAVINPEYRNIRLELMCQELDI